MNWYQHSVPRKVCSLISHVRLKGTISSAQISPLSLPLSALSSHVDETRCTRDSPTLEYRVKHFLGSPLDPLVTLSSNRFTRGKIASEYDVTFERYRSYCTNML